MENKLFLLLLFLLFYLQVGAVQARQAPPDWCFSWSRDPIIKKFKCIAFRKNYTDVLTMKIRLQGFSQLDGIHQQKDSK
jgi:hypothetical protein